MVIVGRHINRITINPLLEYLRNDNGDTMEFVNEDAAKVFLKTKGFTDDELYQLVFEKVGRHYLKVGQYRPATDESEVIIDREFYRPGYVLKDEEAYETSLDKICYIPELRDTAYTHQNFLDMMDGQIGTEFI